MVMKMNPKTNLFVLKQLSKHDTKGALNIFQIGTLAELNDPIFSRKKHELMEYSVRRHVHLQRPLSNMRWS
eukprot:12902368-Prorocentrum_lima.AAC.1